MLITMIVLGMMIVFIKMVTLIMMIVFSRMIALIMMAVLSRMIVPIKMVMLITMIVFSMMIVLIMMAVFSMMIVLIMMAVLSMMIVFIKMVMLITMIVFSMMIVLVVVVEVYDGPRPDYAAAFLPDKVQFPARKAEGVQGGCQRPGIHPQINKGPQRHIPGDARMAVEVQDLHARFPAFRPLINSADKLCFPHALVFV
jgi:hypothetical protein